MDKKISVATVAKRMNRILAAYREQQAQEASSDDGTSPVASTSSSSSSSSQSTSSASPSKASGDTNCSAERKMVLDKEILNFAAQIDTNESDSDNDVSEPSFSFADSPPKRRCLTNNAATVNQQQQKPKRRRSQPSRTVKRAAVKITPLPMPIKRAPRKVTCTITSSTKSSSPDKRLDQSSSSDSYSDASMVLEFPDSDDSDSAAPVIKTSKPTKRAKPTKSKPAKSIKSSILIKTT